MAVVVKTNGIPFWGIGAPPILEPILVGIGCGSKLNRRGKPQVLVHFSTYQGDPFWNSGFLSHSRLVMFTGVTGFGLAFAHISRGRWMPQPLQGEQGSRFAKLPRLTAFWRWRIVFLTTLRIITSALSKVLLSFFWGGVYAI